MFKRFKPLATKITISILLFSLYVYAYLLWSPASLWHTYIIEVGPPYPSVSKYPSNVILTEEKKKAFEDTIDFLDKENSFYSDSDLSLVKALIKYEIRLHKFGTPFADVRGVSIDKHLESCNDVYKELALERGRFLGNANVFKLLSDCGFSIRETYSDLLLLAVMSGDQEVVKAILESGFRYPGAEENALKQAAGRGHYNIVKLLLDSGVDIHSSEDAALYYASMMGRHDTVALLINKGANLDAANGRSLQTAAINSKLKVAEILLENGAYPWNDEAYKTQSYPMRRLIKKYRKKHPLKSSYNSLPRTSKTNKEQSITVPLYPNLPNSLITFDMSQNEYRERHPEKTFILAEKASRLGHYKKALFLYQRAVELDPLNAKYLNLLAWTLATSPDYMIRDGEQAHALATKLIKFSEKETKEHAYFLDTLAAAQAELGEFEKAILTLSKAIKLLGRLGFHDDASNFKVLLSRYRKNIPYVVTSKAEISTRYREKFGLGMVMP